MKREFEGLIDGDIRKLVRRLQSPLAEITLLTTLPSSVSARSSLRLKLEDGRILKVNTFESEWEARRVATLLRFLDHRHFPKIVTRIGGCLLVQWVDGSPLLPSDCGLELLGKLGEIHAGLHATPLPRRVHLQARPAENWNERLERYFCELSHYQVLTAGEQRLAASLAWSHPPEPSPASLVHKDFCAENMVVDSSGHIWIIDIETLSVDSPDYDLARTWYRWPMETEQYAAYLEGYRRIRSTDRYHEYSLYWKIAVLVESALFRLARRTDGWEIPVMRLQLLLSTASAQSS